jgi:hypothetical protein
LIARLGGRSLQSGAELININAVLATGIHEGVEAGDRAADTAHSELQKNPNGLRPAPHDFVDAHSIVDMQDSGSHAA